MDFWNFVWLIIISFAFICYLMVLWTVLADLFRDHKTSGWVKAIWIVLLFFIPLVTSLVYLIVRGQGMAERSREQAANVKAAQDSYIRDVAGKSPADQIADAKALLDSGVIDENEFQALKSKALA